MLSPYCKSFCFVCCIHADAQTVESVLSLFPFAFGCRAFHILGVSFVFPVKMWWVNVSLSEYKSA